jgi:hypothetical protein
MTAAIWLIDDLAWMPNGSPVGCPLAATATARTITQTQLQAVALAEPTGQKEVRHGVGGAAR